MSTTSLPVLAFAGVLLVTLAEADVGVCRQSGTLKATDTYKCNECCVVGKVYPTYDCSPPVSKSTKAIMTLNNFEAGGDGGDKAECDNKFHKNSELIVALSTGWYGKGGRCGKNIRIYANGKSVVVMVVDECDSLHGCDKPHDYQPPCRNNIVDASLAVWKELGIPAGEGQYSITWSDATPPGKVSTVSPGPTQPRRGRAGHPRRER